jgi:hypothetical protein
MSEEKICVIAYSGYRGEETPRVFVLGSKRIEVVEIQESWIEEGIGDRTTRRFFKVKGGNGEIYKIFYDAKTAEWYNKPQSKSNLSISR